MLKLALGAVPFAGKSEEARRGVSRLDRQGESEVAGAISYIGESGGQSRTRRRMRKGKATRGGKGEVLL